MESNLVKKLFIKTGNKVLLLNAPAGFEEEFKKILDGAELVRSGPADSVQLFVKDKEELEKFVQEAIASVKTGGLLWISYPKGSSKVETDLNRDILWQQMKKYKQEGVSLISVDQVWSAMRFKPA